MVKCIDCKALDFGFTENDCFPHCSVKHSLDLAKGIDRKQPEITREAAYKERECEYFEYEKKEDPEHVFNLTKEEIEEGRKVAIEFQKILKEKMKEKGIRTITIQGEGDD